MSTKRLVSSLGPNIEVRVAPERQDLTRIRTAISPISRICSEGIAPSGHLASIRYSFVNGLGKLLRPDSDSRSCSHPER